MVGTWSNPHQKLDKDFLQSRAPGSIRKDRAKHTAPLSSSLPPSPSEPVRVAGRLLPTTAPPITPVINLTGCPIGKPITQSNHPTCLDYGSFCCLMYPGALFCTPCNEWEEHLHLKCHLDNTICAKKYTCKCKHTSFVEPAVQHIPAYIPSRNHANSKSSFATNKNMPHPLPNKYKQYKSSVLLHDSDVSSTTSASTTKDDDISLCSPVAPPIDLSKQAVESNKEDCKLPAIANTASFCNQTDSQPVLDREMCGTSRNKEEKLSVSVCKSTNVHISDINLPILQATRPSNNTDDDDISNTHKENKRNLCS